MPIQETTRPRARSDAESKQRRVVELWSWLPAFRAVAEREHVQKAARDLHVTASSLSRAVGLVEQTLGKRLFDRVGRNLRLNHDGALLLASVRDGMRLIDDGVAQVLSAQNAGELHVACEGDQPIELVWKAVARLQDESPLLVTTVHDAAGGDVPARLLRGDLDLAVMGHPTTADRVRVDHLATISYGIYCGQSHPLWKRRAPPLDAILGHAFVAPTLVNELAVGDRWPPSIQRTVLLRLPSLEPALAACASGRFLAVLPDAVAAAAPERSMLRRLPSDVIEPSQLYALRRHPLGGADRAAGLLAALTIEVAHAGLAPARATRSLRRKPDGGRR
jgi:DNA-binding transcriptional LysR family regulator